eukprot:CAMPEP_0171123734 /NCGR_PEP_ID=MMETSP0766_2-20121228/107719_1 /TAXON_ID=439317 /ORGANISM="Gambierdiscus australes, Strain CAWD 149" /LENGTH=102 /DNA_ID=CAMNT_0011586619 /DNA_START=80 /DNA_END=388 /DNA_ORIENTATION=-
MTTGSSSRGVVVEGAVASTGFNQAPLGLLSILSGGELTAATPGDACAGAGLSAEDTSHWLLQEVTVEFSSGPALPASGQPQAPDPSSSQGLQEPLMLPLLSW